MGVSVARGVGKEEVLVWSSGWGLPLGRRGPAADCGMDRRQETAGAGGAEKSRCGVAQWPRRARPRRKVLHVLGYQRGKIWRGFCFPFWAFNSEPR